MSENNSRQSTAKAPKNPENVAKARARWDAKKDKQRQHLEERLAAQAEPIDPRARLRELDRRLGKGKGAVKERARLQKLALDNAKK